MIQLCPTGCKGPSASAVRISDPATVQASPEPAGLFPAHNAHLSPGQTILPAPAASERAKRIFSLHDELFSFQCAVEGEGYYCHIIIEHIFRHLDKIYPSMIAPRGPEIFLKFQISTITNYNRFIYPVHYALQHDLTAAVTV